jgi:hypothetical protein
VLHIRWIAEKMGVPPAEAYSRVTNPERFLPLHEATARLLDQLTREYAVTREDGYPLAVDLEGVETARPSVKLSPASARSAAIGVVFTTFPGVLLSFGHCSMDAFPACGCDACRATADEEWARLRSAIMHVVDGRFREVIRREPGRRVYVRWELRSHERIISATGLTRCADRLPWWRFRRTIEWERWPRRF